MQLTGHKRLAQIFAELYEWSLTEKSIWYVEWEGVIKLVGYDPNSKQAVLFDDEGVNPSIWIMQRWWQSSTASP